MQSIVEVAKANALTAQILELASASMTSLNSYKVAIDHLRSAEAHAGPKSDIMGIYGAVRVESGLPFQNGENLNESALDDATSYGLARVGEHQLGAHTQNHLHLNIYTVALIAGVCSVASFSLGASPSVCYSFLRIMGF